MIKKILREIGGKKCKIFIYKFLIRAFERPKDAIRALFEIENDFKFIIGHTYKFKVFERSFIIFYYIY